MRFLIQFGSKAVKDYCQDRGWIQLFKEAGVEMINPGCGACIGCGPRRERDRRRGHRFRHQSQLPGAFGPRQALSGQPLTVAASAFEGRIVAYRPGMFVNKLEPIGAQ